MNTTRKEKKMISANKIDHINATVSNLKESIHFYQKVFGLSSFEKGESHGRPYEIIGNPNSFFLCLYEGEKRKSGAINHFGIHINDFENSLKKLNEMGIELLYGGVIEYPKSRSVYIKDPDNNEIELSEKFGGNFLDPA